jgi:hypothetical protein
MLSVGIIATLPGKTRVHNAVFSARQTNAGRIARNGACVDDVQSTGNGAHTTVNCRHLSRTPNDEQDNIV